jgi:benzoate transport
MADESEGERSMDPRKIIGERRMGTLQWVAVAICVLLNALDGFDVLAITFAAPGIAEHWGLDPAEIGIVISIGLVGMAVGSLALAPLADILGRRWTVLVSLVVMAGGMFLSAVATSILTLGLWRFITGLGIGTMLAAINAVAAEYANDRRRALAVSLMAIGYPIGGVVGGSIAAWLLRHHGWESVFVFGGLVTAATIIPVLIFIPESIDFLTTRGKGDVLTRINVILRRMGHPESDQLPVREKAPRVPTAAIFAPNMIRRTLTIAASYFLHVITFYYFIGWLPSIVTAAGFEKSDGTAASVWANLGGAVGGAIFGVIAARVGVKPVLLVVMVASWGATVLFGQTPADLTLLKAAAFFADFFINAGIVGLYSVMAMAYPASLRATGTGFAIGIGRGGGVLGPIIAGYLMKAGVIDSTVAWIMATGSLLAAVMLATLPRRQTETSAA